MFSTVQRLNTLSSLWVNALLFACLWMTVSVYFDKKEAVSEFDRNKNVTLSMYYNVMPQVGLLIWGNGQAAESQSRAFKESVNFGAILLTKMDGHAKGGGALSAISASKTPIVFIGTGEHIYDLEKFVPNSFISKLLGMGDIQGFMEHFQSLKLEQISMIPGTAQMMEGIEEESSRKFKRLIYIMDSMTEKELDSDGKIFTNEPSRIIRIAMGSGTSVSEVKGLLSQHHIMAGIAKKVGEKGGLKNQNMNPNLLKNPQQIASIQKRLQSIGSSSGIPGMDMDQIMKMANQIMSGKKSGVMPDFSNLMSQFASIFN
ncbi:unnamed protein product, partial [Pneumocystis jirovecii]